MRTLVAVLLVLTPALAGCLTSNDDTPGPTDPATPAHGLLPDGSPAPAFMQWSECVAQGGAFPAPMAALRPHLAEGLNPVPYAGDPSGSQGTWGVSSHRCHGITDLWVFIQVTPSDTLAGDAAFSYVPVRVLTSNATVAATMGAWGVMAFTHDADVSFDLVDDAGGARVGRAEGGGVELDIMAAGAVPGEPMTTRGFAVEDGVIVSIVDFRSTDELTSQGAAAFRASEPPFPGAPTDAEGAGGHGWGPFDYEVVHVDPAGLPGEGE